MCLIKCGCTATVIKEEGSSAVRGPPDKGDAGEGSGR